MGARGPAPKPHLQVVREGNPSKKPIPESIVLPPGILEEPDRSDTFPDPEDGSDKTVSIRARHIAAREWTRVVPVLRHTAGLAEVDATVLHDYCVCVARLDQCEREISLHGMLIQGERGWQKNGATTVAGQYRVQLKTYIRELGLSPSARTGMAPPKGNGDDDGDPFD